MEIVKRLYKTTYQHALPQIPREQIRLLWHGAYHDGPISGVCEFRGEKCWFDMLLETDPVVAPSKDEEGELDVIVPSFRHYVVIKLTDEQYQFVLERHQKFQRMVGTHTDYDENWKRGTYGNDPGVTKETTKQYFEESKHEKWPLWLPESGVIFGWFEW